MLLLYKESRNQFSTKLRNVILSEFCFYHQCPSMSADKRADLWRLPKQFTKTQEAFSHLKSKFSSQQFRSNFRALLRGSVGNLSPIFPLDVGH